MAIVLDFAIVGDVALVVHDAMVLDGFTMVEDIWWRIGTNYA